LADFQAEFPLRVASLSAPSGCGVSFSSVTTRHPVRARAGSLLALAVALTFAASAGCAGESSARKPCPSDAWVGNCTLRDLRKVEEREMPIPYVVYEATYTPVPNADYPQFTPAEVRLRIGTPASHEFALIDHIKPQAVVSCHAPNAAGTCLPQEVVADVVPFDPDQAVAAAVPQTTGCAAINAASEQDRLAKSRDNTQVVISERFSFAEGSAALPPEATTAASAVARRMNDDPTLECVGLVGQSSPGESPSLAEARARAVKQLLISLGVDKKRLDTIAATASVYGAASATTAPPAESRRVSLSVLLKTVEKSAQ
jgi:outer membrane protein OmpA-like peptidoglycan-associated protein